MYIWKCWRESRNRVITFLILLVSTAVLFAFTDAAVRERLPHTAPKPPVLEMLWATLLSLGTIVVSFIGLGLGSSGIGEEFAQGTQEFLLTRPRRRRYFVWAAWATGAVELFIIVALAIVASFVTLAYVIKSAGSWKLLEVILPLFVFGAVVYSLTYFMTALLKDGRSGLIVSLGLFVLYLLLPVALNLPWVVDFLHRKINLPTPVDVLVGASKWATIPGAHFPLVTTLGWCLVALAFPLAAQFFFERAEV
jgi:ABC-type transport system involved in multi-copper enzyme maturation permease subunit